MKQYDILTVLILIFFVLVILIVLANIYTVVIHFIFGGQYFILLFKVFIILAVVQCVSFIYKWITNG